MLYEAIAIEGVECEFEMGSRCGHGGETKRMRRESTELEPGRTFKASRLCQVLFCSVHGAPLIIIDIDISIKVSSKFKVQMTPVQSVQTHSRASVVRALKTYK